jgi:hypothetical protein
MATKVKNPYGTLGPSRATVQKVTPRYPAIPAYQPTNPGWGGATQANDMSRYGYDVPGTALAPSQPTGASGYQEPDWNALIAGDPTYSGALAGINKQNQFDRGALQEAIRRAVTQSGYNLGTDDWIDATTQQAAAANPLSTRAQIADQLRQGSAQSDAALAARGILSSGQFTQNRGQLQRGADTADAAARDQLLSTILGGQTNYANAVSGRDAELRALRESVAGRLAQNPGIYGPGPAEAPAAPAAPAAAAPFAGISWGGRTGIKTRAQLISALAPGVTWAQWAANHPDAAGRLT